MFALSNGAAPLASARPDGPEEKDYFWPKKRWVRQLPFGSTAKLRTLVEARDRPLAVVIWLEGAPWKSTRLLQAIRLSNKRAADGMVPLRRRPLSKFCVALDQVAPMVKADAPELKVRPAKLKPAVRLLVSAAPAVDSRRYARPVEAGNSFGLNHEPGCFPAVVAASGGGAWRARSVAASISRIVALPRSRLGSLDK
jgi:hypothetical protein